MSAGDEEALEVARYIQGPDLRKRARELAALFQRWMDVRLTGLSTPAEADAAEGREAVECLGIDVKAWAGDVREKIAACAPAPEVELLDKALHREQRKVQDLQRRLAAMRATLRGIVAMGQQLPFDYGVARRMVVAAQDRLEADDGGRTTPRDGEGVEPLPMPIVDEIDAAIRAETPSPRGKDALDTFKYLRRIGERCFRLGQEDVRRSVTPEFQELLRASEAVREAIASGGDGDPEVEVLLAVYDRVKKGLGR